MSITAALFVLVYVAGLILAFAKHPKFGLYSYLFEFYLHPISRWWGHDLPDLRWSFLAAMVTFVAILVRNTKDGRRPWTNNFGAVFYIALLSWMVLQFAWEITGKWHILGTNIVANFLVLYFVIYKSIEDEKSIRTFFLIHIIGCCYLSYLAYTHGSGRMEGIGGPGISDSNSFGMHLSTAVGFAAALLLRGNFYQRAFMALAAPFILNGVVLTQSRGAFVGLCGSALAMIILKDPGKRVTFYALGVIALFAALSLMPPNFTERMSTILNAADETTQVDTSIRTRQILIGLQLKIAAEHPLGVGFKGTAVLSKNYLDPKYLTQGSRASHNTYMSYLVDHGIPGLFLYLWMLFTAASQHLKLRAAFIASGQTHLIDYLMALGSAIAIVAITGMASNFFRAEILVWCLALFACLRNLLIEPGAKDAVPAEGTESGDAVTQN